MCAGWYVDFWQAASSTHFVTDASYVLHHVASAHLWLHPQFQWIVPSEFDNVPRGFKCFLWCPGSLLSQHENAAWKWGWYSQTQASSKREEGVSVPDPHSSGRQFCGLWKVNQEEVLAEPVPCCFHLRFCRYTASWAFFPSCLSTLSPMLASWHLPLW